MYIPVTEITNVSNTYKMLLHMRRTLDAGMPLTANERNIVSRLADEHPTGLVADGLMSVCNALPTAEAEAMGVRFLDCADRPELVSGALRVLRRHDLTAKYRDRILAILRGVQPPSDRNRRVTTQALAAIGHHLKSHQDKEYAETLRHYAIRPYSHDASSAANSAGISARFAACDAPGAYTEEVHKKPELEARLVARFLAERADG